MIEKIDKIRELYRSQDKSERAVAQNLLETLAGETLSFDTSLLIEGFTYNFYTIKVHEGIRYLQVDTCVWKGYLETISFTDGFSLLVHVEYEPGGTRQKIMELETGDEQEQEVAQEMMRQLIQKPCLLQMADLKVNSIRNLTCIEKSRKGRLSIVSYEDVWTGQRFARNTISNVEGLESVIIEVGPDMDIPFTPIHGMLLNRVHQL